LYIKKVFCLGGAARATNPGTTGTHLGEMKELVYPELGL